MERMSDHERWPLLYLFHLLFPQIGLQGLWLLKAADCGAGLEAWVGRRRSGEHSGMVCTLYITFLD